MNCWHCKTPLIWGGDHDVDDNDSEYAWKLTLVAQHVIHLLWSTSLKK